MSVSVAAGICHLLQLGMQHGMLLRLLVAVAAVVVNAGVQIAPKQHSNSRPKTVCHMHSSYSCATVAGVAAVRP